MPDETLLTPRSAAPRPRFGRALIGLLAAAILLLTMSSGDADAWSPRAPRGTYSPRHAWQLKDNCVWAAGQMLLDKWTHGQVHAYQGRLRRASGDRKGGSSLYDLARGVYRLTHIHLESSPSGGDPMTWWQLLDRLEGGGGAVLIGEYSRMPAHFTRWDRSFARKRQSSHAVFVERYDRVQGRVWLMDPLAEGGYPGEWIGVATLRHYASFEGKLVVAAATPARHHPSSAPLTDTAYVVKAPRLGPTAIAGSTLAVAIPLAIRYGFPTPAAHRLVATWIPIPAAPAPNLSTTTRAVVDTLPSAGSDRPAPVATATTSGSGRAGRGGFRNAIPVPTVPGRYLVSLALADSDAGAIERRFAPVEVDVIGPYAATWSVQAPRETTVGTTMTVKIAVANIGTVDWRTPKRATDLPRVAAPPPQTVLVLRWMSPGRVVPAGSVPVEAGPGAAANLKVRVTAPLVAGPWVLALDLVNLEAGAMSSSGLDVPAVPILVDPKGLAGEP